MRLQIDAASGAKPLAALQRGKAKQQDAGLTWQWNQRCIYKKAAQMGQLEQLATNPQASS